MHSLHDPQQLSDSLLGIDCSTNLHKLVCTDYTKDRDDEEGREVRLVLFSIRIGTYMLPRECSYTKVYRSLCSPVIQIQVPLASRGNLRCYSACLGVTLLL